jgi:hypothetical protein
MEARGAGRRKWCERNTWTICNRCVERHSDYREVKACILLDKTLRVRQVSKGLDALETVPSLPPRDPFFVTERLSRVMAQS